MNRAIHILIIYHMQITGVVGILVGLSIILFEVFPEESDLSIPVRQADEHMIAVPVSDPHSLTRSTGVVGSPRANSWR